MNRKIKLLFVTYTHSNGGGAEAVLTTLVNNLNPDTYEIDILEYQAFCIKNEPINSNISFLGSVIKKNDKKTKELEYVFCKYPKIIKKLYKIDNYDVVISWNYQKPSFILPAFENEKKISWFHGEISDLLPGTKQYETQKKVWDITDKIVTISDKSLASLPLRYPEFFNKTKIIHNGTDINKVLSLANVDIISDKESKLSILCSLGRLDNNKNQTLLLQAVSELKKNNIICNVQLIGTGECQKKLEDLSLKLGISEQVNFVGYQKNPYPYIKNSDILCMTSLSEGFPTVVCEAMALGKPFVTTPVAGASEELANDGKCGIVSSYDVKEYAEAIKKLISNKVLYEDMSKNCIEHIKNFTINKAIENFNNLIKSLDIEKISTEKEKNKFTKIKFAFLCIQSKFFDIKPATNLFLKKKNVYNFAKTCYYSLRLILNIGLYPLFFIYYFSFACNKEKECLKK